jgi:hypothetical protein
MISNDPVLGSVKLIAEAWDAGGLYQVGGSGGCVKLTAVRPIACKRLVSTLERIN